MSELALQRMELDLPGVEEIYHGKVRDVYRLKDGRLIMVASDRISAFDVILPRGIPHKGQVLNQLSWRFLEATRHVAPNWATATPDPNVIVGHACDPVKVEMVVRGYLAGHAWRTYRDGKRMLCGVKMPDGMKENDSFPEPMITPSTKADAGHDEDTTPEEILDNGWATEEEWETMSKYALDLFTEGTRIARERGLILVDTKYEFGRKDGKILLIDEIHTPDSSRYFYTDGYKERQAKGGRQKQLSKEFVREWLISQGFMGKEGQQVPPMTDEVLGRISSRYIELYEQVTGEQFTPAPTDAMDRRIKNNLQNYLASS